MAKKTLDIIDESGDKKYFTIIPNYILNHSSANDQALYLQMKRLANDNEICYASEKYFMDKLNIGRQALKKSIQYLIDHKWISFTGYREAQTKGGKQRVKTYKIVDLWKINIGHYQKGVSEKTPLTKTEGVSEMTQRGVQNDTQGVSEMTSKKNVLLRTKNIKQSEIAGVNDILGLFKKINPAINFGNKTQRKACISLLEEKGIEDSIKVVEYALSIQGERYAPTITTPHQLWTNYAKLQNYYNKNNKPLIQSL